MLIQSAKENKESDKGLTLDEFQNLVFASEDQLAVNLSALAPHSESTVSKPPTGHSQAIVKEDLGDFKFYLLNLQRGIKNVCNDLLRDDEERTFLADKESLIKVLERRSNAPEQFRDIHRQDLIEYVGKFSQENNKIEYKNMVEDIMNFEFTEPSQPRSQATVKSGLTDAIAHNEPKSIFEDDYVVLDSRKVPQNTIEQIEQKMIKINRRLKKTFTSEQEFEKKLKDNLPADVNGNVTVDQLRDYFLGLVE